MKIETDYEHLSQPMRRHIRALLSGSQSVPESIVNQQIRFERRIRDSGLSDKLIHLLAGVQDPQSRANEPFEIFVMGEGKHGKSTFINAVLGDHIAKTGWLPKTWCFNRYIAVESPSAHVKVFVDSHLMEKEDSPELKKMLGRPVGKFRNLEVYQVTHEMADVLIDNEEQLVGNSLGSSRPYHSPIMEIEWSIFAPNAILPGIRLVDTMGINQKLAPSSHLHHLKWQYERADAVIWIVAAEKIGAMELRKEMLEAKRYSKQLILVINKWDQLNESTRIRALKRAELEYGQLVSSVVPMSSLTALYALAGLSPESSDDEKAYAKSFKGVKNEGILKMSGMPLLKEVLSQFIDGRQQLTKNLQTYSALRAKGNEFRLMVNNAIEYAGKNIQLYEELTQKIKDARIESMNQINCDIDKLKNIALDNLRDRANSINYSTRHNARGLLQLDTLKNDLRTLVNNLENSATATYSGVLTWLAEDEHYRDPLFSPTGQVAAKISTKCLNKSTVKIDVGTITWNFQDPVDLIQQIFISINNVLTHIPIIGDYFRDLARKQEREATEQIRSEIKDKLIPQVKEQIESEKVKLIESTQLVAEDLLFDVDEQFALTGGLENHKNTLVKAKEALNGPIIEPLLITLPNKLLRQLNWSKL